jgi:hypothetical protein
MLSQTQVPFCGINFELNEKTDHIPHDMMNNEQTTTQVKFNSSPKMLSQTQVQFCGINFELNESSGHTPPDMMTTKQSKTTQFYFPKEAMKKILDFCGETIEQKQRRLWKRIKIDRREYWHDGHACGCGENGNPCSDHEKLTDIEYISGGDTIIQQDNWECDQENGDCLSVVLADDEYWNNRIRTINEESY